MQKRYDLTVKTMSENKPIKVDHFGKTAVIRFVRPDIKNPLSIHTLENLKYIFDKLNKDQDLSSIVFTGTGNTFAAGANLKEVAILNEINAKKFGMRGQNLMQEIYNSDKYTIAAIDGFCMGGALDLSMSCKLRIASPNSYFAHPGAKLGIITGWGGTQLLPKIVGKKKALELLLLAKRINAKEAFEIGLIDEIALEPLAKSLEPF